MYLINTTFVVEPDIQDSWLRIIKENYIPLVRHRGFRINAFSRIISIEPSEHFTYSLLVEAEDMARYKELIEDIFNEYLAVAEPLFGTRVMWFTSLMKRLELPGEQE